MVGILLSSYVMSCISWNYNNDDCISMRKVYTMITEHMCMYY